MQKSKVGKVKIKIIKKVNRKNLVQLYKEADWWKQRYSKDLSFMEGIVNNSFCFVGAFYNNKMVGMGRSISDGVSDAYIQDVVVSKKFRDKGIGRRIIAKIVKYLKSRNIDWIGVIAKPETRRFYKNAGFEILNGYVPMLFKHKK